MRFIYLFKYFVSFLLIGIQNIGLQPFMQYFFEQNKTFLFLLLIIPLKQGIILEILIKINIPKGIFRPIIGLIPKPPLGGHLIALPTPINIFQPRRIILIMIPTIFLLAHRIYIFVCYCHWSYLHLFYVVNVTVFVIEEVFIHVFLLHALSYYVHHLELFLVVHVHAQTLTVCCVVALVVRIMPHFHQTLIQILGDPFLLIPIFMHFQILPKFLLIKLLSIQLTLSLYLFPNP